MIRRTIILGGLCGLVVSIALVSTGWAQTETYDVEATWTKPTYGSEPTSYHVWVRSKADGAEVFDNWEEWATTSELSHVLTFEKERCYEVRINAEDTNGNIGPFSTPSLEFCGTKMPDEESGPGQPGQPVRKE